MFHLAAPSCVFPDRVGPNCQSLSCLVSEVALMLLETRACLAYNHLDLPPDLSALGLRYHAHLPVDLPWAQGVDAVAACLLGLKRKVAFLHPHAAVLHPPAPGALTALLAGWPELGPGLCLENTPDNDLSAIWDEILALDLGVCLDIGHMVSFGQEHVLRYPALFKRIRIVHVYGGESGAGHESLAALPDVDVLRGILERIRSDCTLVVEVFSWEKLFESLPLLRSWLEQWGLAHG